MKIEYSEISCEIKNQKRRGNPFIGRQPTSPKMKGKKSRNNQVASEGNDSFLRLQMYSAFNHKRVTAAKCRESHHLRTDATTAVPFRTGVV
jgi:hypothetical protein